MHRNGMENFWSLVRAIKGMYVSEANTSDRQANHTDL